MNVEVRESPVHGLGVFARDFIYCDHWQYVYGYMRRVTPGDPVERFTIHHDDENSFVPYAPWCFLNHSNIPNCELWWDEESGFTLVALCNILEGEELLIDYGFTPEC